MKLQDFTFRPIPTPRTCFIVAGSAKKRQKTRTKARHVLQRGTARLTLDEGVLYQILKKTGPSFPGTRSPSSASTLQKLRQALRSWGSALPGAEVF